MSMAQSYIIKIKNYNQKHRGFYKKPLGLYFNILRDDIAQNVECVKKANTEWIFK